MTITILAKSVIESGLAKSGIIATAESCTGGLVAAALTDIAGSSAVFDRGFVTYSNEAKAEMLGVPEGLIAEHGAVSAPVAAAMATGALNNSKANLAVSVTGIAGPTGGSAEKPVGLVYIAVQREGAAAHVSKCLFAEEGHTGRSAIRQATVIRALEMLLQQLRPAQAD